MERRNHTRFKLCTPIEIRLTDSDAPIRAETTDLSRGGVYVEMMFTLEVGTKVDILLRLGELTVLAMGEVVTCDRTVGNGIRFTKMLDEDREALDTFLRDFRATQKEDITTRTLKGVTQ